MSNEYSHMLVFACLGSFVALLAGPHILIIIKTFAKLLNEIFY